jgi:hypothetical protein
MYVHVACIWVYVCVHVYVCAMCAIKCVPIPTMVHNYFVHAAALHTSARTQDVFVRAEDHAQGCCAGMGANAVLQCR